MVSQNANGNPLAYYTWALACWKLDVARADRPRTRLWAALGVAARIES